jgi:adenylate kinase family enzyme
LAAADGGMRRVLVTGSPGSGKSTLARELGEKLQVPVIHLDFHFWKPGWQPVEEVVFRERVSELCATPAWVMDGNYAQTFDIRIPRADTLVWLECSRVTCLLRVLRRSLRDYGRSSGRLPAGCPERIDYQFYRYVWDFPEKYRPHIVNGIDELGRHLRLVHLCDNRARQQFIDAAEVG